MYNKDGYCLLFYLNHKSLVYKTKVLCIEKVINQILEIAPLIISNVDIFLPLAFLLHFLNFIPLPSPSLLHCTLRTVFRLVDLLIAFPDSLVKKVQGVKKSSQLGGMVTCSASMLSDPGSNSGEVAIFPLWISGLTQALGRQ